MSFQWRDRACPAENHHHRHGRPRANAPFWYSYDYGSVHFTVISTEHSLEHGSAQHEVRPIDVNLAFAQAHAGAGLLHMAWVAPSPTAGELPH